MYTRKNEQLDQCCQQLVAMLCCTLSTTVVNNHCSQSFTFNNHRSVIVDNDQQTFFINYCQLLFQQHCNNYCSLSTSSNYWSNNNHQHCEFNVLLNLDRNIVQALFNEQRCINLINFCACRKGFCKRFAEAGGYVMYSSFLNGVIGIVTGAFVAEVVI